ncbi:thioester reductase-like protein [Amycolatopsis sulphurea]|uniref:Thioester reductase-like protein n=1 Tax=Amycolatopsis sulphurea TaxID=76022 RepID=A0A2A9G3U0_9PSEU|nr:SDR family oxidoreductase [Amycolatopsis sulphurea]PFG57319.1 thioester reductase-like protein [Amycolatopsis sulphurea]
MSGVVLTGVTGFLGAHLAAALLQHTDTTVYCLIRAEGLGAARRRLQERVAALGPLQYPERLVPVCVDIEHPSLGLTRRDWDELADHTAAIHHCAAAVHLTAGYRELAAANVGGTRELLKLAETAAARRGHVVAFHFVSTLGVFIDARRAGMTTVDETTTPTMTTAGPLGYPRSKVAAERELRRADERGVTPVVYRPGLITGRSDTGLAISGDLLAPLLLATVALRAKPDGLWATPMETVDQVARQQAVLATTHPPAGRAFHLIHPEPQHLDHATAALERAGFHLRTVPAAQWENLLNTHATHTALAPLARLGPVGRRLAGIDPNYTAPTIHSDRTWAALSRAGMRPVNVGEAYFDKLIDGLAPQLFKIKPIPTYSQ